MYEIQIGQMKVPSFASGIARGRAFMPFAKVDRQQRIVWGVGQTEEEGPDSQNDIVDFDGTIKAFKNWAGNVREMHGDIAAGRAIKVMALPEVKKVMVGAHVSEGAESTWQKVLDGTLRGFSIGGSVIRSRMELNKATGKRIHKILEYQLDELSLVDNPANASCIVTAVLKRGTTLEFRQTSRKAYELTGRIALDLV